MQGSRPSLRSVGAAGYAPIARRPLGRPEPDDGPEAALRAVPVTCPEPGRRRPRPWSARLGPGVPTGTSARMGLVPPSTHPSGLGRRLPRYGVPDEDLAADPGDWTSLPRIPVTYADGGDMRRPQPAMSVHDVAEFLNVDEKTIYRLAQRGQLPGFKVAGIWRFQRKDLDRWIDEGKRRPSPGPDRSQGVGAVETQRSKS